MPTRLFKWYLNGLSLESRFMKAIGDKKQTRVATRRARKQ